MAHEVQTDVKLYLAHYDLSGDMNAIGAEIGAEVQDDTNYGDTSRVRLGGLKFFRFSHAGRVDMVDDGIDEQLFSRIGVANVPMTISHDGGDDGEIAHFARVVTGQYNPSGAVGEVLKFAVSGEGDGDEAVRGTIMIAGQKSASAQGTARQLGAVSAAQSVYSALHCTQFNGTSLDVLVRSDDGVGMASPTTRITFTQLTAIGSQWATPVAGAITDDYWQIDFTFVGTNATFLVPVGIQ